MMGYGEYGSNVGVMGGSMGVFGLLVMSIVLIDLILVGVWLWQHISKK